MSSIRRIVIAASVANLRLLILLMAGSNSPSLLLAQIRDPLMRSGPTLKERSSHVTYRRHNTIIFTHLCTTPLKYTSLSCDSHVTFLPLTHHLGSAFSILVIHKFTEMVRANCSLVPSSHINIPQPHHYGLA